MLLDLLVESPIRLTLDCSVNRNFLFNPLYYFIVVLFYFCLSSLNEVNSYILSSGALSRIEMECICILNSVGLLLVY